MKKPKPIEIKAYHWQEIADWIKHKYKKDIFNWDKTLYQNFANVCFVKPCSGCERCRNCQDSIEVAALYISPEMYSQPWEREIAEIIKKEFYPKTKSKIVNVYLGSL